MVKQFVAWLQRRTCKQEGFPCSYCPNGMNFKGWGTPVLPYLEWRGACQWVPLSAERTNAAAALAASPSTQTPEKK